MELGFENTLSLAFTMSMADLLAPFSFLSIREVRWGNDRFLIESGSMGPVVWTGMGIGGGDGVRGACGTATRLRFHSTVVGSNGLQGVQGSDGV